MTPQQAADKIMQAVAEQLCYSVEERKSRLREDVLGVLEEMNQWLPIETAPKDGTWVLIRGGEIAYEWDGDSNPPAVVAQYTNYRNGKTIEYHWQFAWYDGGYYGGYDNATHWQPLPAPPQALTAKE